MVSKCSRPAVVVMKNRASIHAVSRPEWNGIAVAADPAAERLASQLDRRRR